MANGMQAGLRIDPPSDRLKNLFLGAVFVMLLHKVECWLTAEWLESPFFQSLVTSAYWSGMDTEAIAGEAMFLTFIFWLFVGLGMGWLVLRGGMWPTVALAGWGLTFVLEWHHVLRTLSRGAYYSGVVTSTMYLIFGVFYLRELARHVHFSRPDAVGSS